MPSTATWYEYDSQSKTISSFVLGTPNSSVPVVGYFDPNGPEEPAVFTGKVCGKSPAPPPVYHPSRSGKPVTFRCQATTPASATTSWPCIDPVPDSSWFESPVRMGRHDRYDHDSWDRCRFDRPEQPRSRSRSVRPLLQLNNANLDREHRARRLRSEHRCVHDPRAQRGVRGDRLPEGRYPGPSRLRRQRLDTTGRLPTEHGPIHWGRGGNDCHLRAVE